MSTRGANVSNIFCQSGLYFYLYLTISQLNIAAILQRNTLILAFTDETLALLLLLFGVTIMSKWQMYIQYSCLFTSVFGLHHLLH